MERLNLGRTIVLSNETFGTAQVVAADVKNVLNIGFNTHDTNLDHICKSVISEVERITETTLITEREVSVIWQSFYDDEILPYCPIKAETNVTVKDLEGVDYPVADYQLVNNGRIYRLVGDFPDGVKLTYTTSKLTITETQKLAIARIAAEVFSNPTADMGMLVLKNVKIFRFY
jgi:hypothetical protein